MKVFILSLLMVFSLFGSELSDLSDLKNELNHLSDSQQEVLLRTFLKGKEYNLEYTLTAIAWQESKFGKYMVNLSDPSFGVFHNLIKSVQKRHRANKWNTDRLAERLLFDYNFSFNEALEELTFWKKVYKGQTRAWSKIVSSYNSGWDSSAGEAYLYCIRTKIKALRTYEVLTEIKE